MWLDEDTPILKHDFVLAKPFVNAPGMLGFAPDPHTMPFLEHLGAFITNPISRTPRQPAKNRAYLPFLGGFLLHSGKPNPGIRRVIQQNKRSWAEAALPVIVHLLAESPESVAEMVRKLEGLENILAVELGLPPDCSASILRDFMDSATGELPVLVNLDCWQMPILLEVLEDLQPAAIQLSAPRGSLVNAKGDLVSGRLYGPALFPSTLSTIKAAVEAGLPIIGGCGIYQMKQAQTLLDTGAFAVSLNAVLWGENSSELFC